MAQHSLAELTRQYQAQLEAVRTIFWSDAFDEDAKDEAIVDLTEAERAVGVAWLEHKYQLKDSNV